MLTGYPLSCTLGRSVLGIGSGVARFLMITEYATYRYLRCVVNVMLLLSQLSVSFGRIFKRPDFKQPNRAKAWMQNVIVSVKVAIIKATYYTNLENRFTTSTYLA